MRADTVLETETAELGAKGTGLVSNSVQFEKGREGKTAFTLTQFEYGITDRAEILIEPFFHEWIRPKGGPSIHGMGDIEITPSYMVVLDKKESWVPACAEAGDFAQAVQWETKYLETPALPEKAARAGQSRLACYQAHEAYRADR